MAVTKWFMDCSLQMFVFLVSRNNVCRALIIVTTELAGQAEDKDKKAYINMLDSQSMLNNNRNIMIHDIPV